MLEAKVAERTRALEEAQIEIVERLAMAAEFRDDNTGQHTQRVGQMSALLARQLGMPDAQVSLIRRAAPLHDVGKIGVPDTILMKLGKLTDDEFDRRQDPHGHRGADPLGRQVSAPAARGGDRVFTSRALGRDGLRGDGRDDIPLAGRIVAVADVFDALTQQRPYKPAWPVREAIAEIDRQRGRQFDPGVVDAFMRVIEAQMEVGGRS